MTVNHRFRDRARSHARGGQSQTFSIQTSMSDAPRTAERRRGQGPRRNTPGHSSGLERLNGAECAPSDVAQRLGGLVVVPVRRVVQRAAAPPVLRVGVGARREQVHDGRQPALARRQVQRRARVVIRHGDLVGVRDGLGVRVRVKVRVRVRVRV